MRIKDHALSFTFAGAFLLSLAGQSLAGLAAYNKEHLAHGAPTESWLGFVLSSDFVVDVAENWQSEYLQFFLFIFATVWLVQHGSSESKPVGAPHRICLWNRSSRYRSTACSAVLQALVWSS